MTSTEITPITASLLSKKSLSVRLGLSIRTLENMVLAKQFPAGVRIGKFVFWSEAVVQKWQKRIFGVQEGWQA
jgi:predicted DNA-binding transcriptional regulator AlpA